MNNSEEIRNSIKEITAQPFHTRLGKVLDVDSERFTCEVEPLDGGPQHLDVRLKAIIDGKESGLIPIPTKDSTVLITLINNDPDFAFVSGVSEVDRYLIKNSEGYVIDLKKEGCTIKVGETSLDMKESSLELVQSAGGSIKISDELPCIAIENKSGQDLISIIDDILTQIMAITVPTAMGPSGTPLNTSFFTKIKANLKTLNLNLKI